MQRLIYSASAAIVSMLWTTAAHAQSYPIRPVRVIVPFPAGGGLDIVMRPVNEKLAAAFGQTFIADNRPGADGMIGTQLGAKATPDGYTLLASSTGPMVINAALNPVLKLGMPYDTLRDFAPITLLVVQPMVLVVHPSLPVHSVHELVAFAKARPDQVNYGSGGIGNGAHLAGEMFKSATGTKIVHVPYKGAAPAVVELIAGQVQMMINSIPVLLPHIRNGRLRPLAIGADHHMQVLPDVPTMQEAGVARFNANSWYGLFAPAGTPGNIVARLNAEAVKVLRSKEMRDYMVPQGAEPIGNTPEEFAAHIQAELAKWRRAVSDAGIRSE